MTNQPDNFQNNDLIQAHYANRYLRSMAPGKNGRIARSTFSPRVALCMLPYFQQFEQTKQPVCVLYSDFFTNSPTTIRKKLNDAITWFIDRGTDEEKQRFAIIKATTVFRMSDNASEGIWIEPRVYAGVVIPVSKKEEKELEKINEKDVILKWIREAQPQDMLDTPMKFKSEEARMEIEQMLGKLNEDSIVKGQPEIGFKVLMDRIVIIK